MAPPSVLTLTARLGAEKKERKELRTPCESASTKPGFTVRSASSKREKTKSVA